MPKPSKATSKIDSNLYSAAELADVFGIAESKVKWLGGRKHLARVGRGKYDLLKSITSYLKYLQNSHSENICTIQDLCDLTGIPLRTMQLYAQENHAVAGKKRGTYLKRESVTGIVKHVSGGSEEQKKRASEQQSRDLNNAIKAEELRVKRDQVLDREVMKVAKTQYIASIVKRHISWRPRMKKQFRDISEEILDYCDDELLKIRESCKVFRVDESEPDDGEYD